MALHLVTGVPGAGKTLNTLKLVHTKAAQQGRPVYYRGIKLVRDNPHGINYDNWFEMRHPNDGGVDLATDVTPWSWQNVPDGAIILVDEAHHFYPATSPTARHPAYIMDMSEHRHRGIDIYLITQGPDLINSTIKNWVNEHHHYRLFFGGLLNIRYTNEKCVNNVRNTRELSQEASKKRIKHDKRWYDAYISASIHYGRKRVPIRIIAILLIALLMIFGGIIYVSRGYFAVGQSSQPEILQPQPAYQHGEYPQGPLKGNANPALLGVLDASASSADRFDPITAYTPRIAAMPETAPAYDDLRKPKTHPRPQCLINRQRDTCTCYTQQATLMQDYPDELCRTYATRGYFDPTRADPEPPPPETRKTPETDSTAATAGTMPSINLNLSPLAGGGLLPVGGEAATAAN